MIQSIYSLKELHKILENHDKKDKIMLWFDIDLTLIHPNPENEDQDVLIEPEITKKLFQYIMDNEIAFSFITGRFSDTVCNSKTRNLDDIKENIVETIYPFFQELGIDISDFLKDDRVEIIKSEGGKTVGIIYKGIIFSGNKGSSIKSYAKTFGFDKTNPLNIFIDDYDLYIRSVAKHLPKTLILKREIP